MAISTPEKRGRLEDAFAASVKANPVTSLRAYLRVQETAARQAVKSGSIKLTLANAQRVEMADYGPGQITPLEVAELFRWLVDQFDQSFLWLSQCCNFGLDAFNAEFTMWPNSPTAVAPPGNTIVDQTGRWLIYCNMLGLDPTLVIGQTVNDTTIYVWLMYHLYPTVEARDDHSQIRINTGAQFI